MFRNIILLIVSLSLSVACAPRTDHPSETASVVDTYHGTDVADPYRWLEDWSDPAVQAWSEEKNRTARAHLDAIPEIGELRRRIAAIEQAESMSYSNLQWCKDHLLALKEQSDRDQPQLVSMPSADEPGAERVVVDPTIIDPSGKTTIDWYVGSPDGHLVAVSLSTAGTESGDVHFFEVAGGRQVGRVIARAHGGTAGGSLAWSGDGEHVYFTRYPRAGERPEEDLPFFQQLWSGSWRTADEDRKELGDELPRVAEIKVEVSPDSDRLVATVQHGDSGRFELWLKQSGGSWQRLSEVGDEVVQATFATDGSLFMISRKEAPRGQVLSLGPGSTSLDDAVVVVAESADTVVSYFWGPPTMVATAHQLWVSYQLGGPSTIRVFDHAGLEQARPEVPPVSSIGQIVPAADGCVLFSATSYLEPRSWYAVDGGRTHRTAISSSSPVDFSALEVVRDMVRSKDGTVIPLNIVRRKGADGAQPAPALLSGYGGFGVSIRPHFDPILAVWFEAGGIYAQANIRGGGEFGEEWHRQGMLTYKQNGFDDFAACMGHLVDAGYTTPDRLAILGGSNGGLLMGAMITQHPAACRAVVSIVGIYDMLRVELSSNGAFNIPEYGSVSDPEQFHALYAYSPYHRVVNGTAYPAVLFMTGANDPRVDPMQSRKMTARLQEATSSGHPVLLRTSADTGHGGGTPMSERIEEEAAMYAFLFDELGMR